MLIWLYMRNVKRRVVRCALLMRIKETDIADIRSEGEVV
jgi:hypothetical protein